MTKGCKALVDEARAKIRTISFEEARSKHGDPDVVFVDIRDVRELEREGMVPGAFHAPRGMLEFWIDPDTPYYKDVFGSGKEFVFYCASAWRSALATAVAQEMGLSPVCHMDGGFNGWKKNGGPVAERSEKAGK
ncbi:MAG: rhodanese-like domain-containing protein [Betaproteobacteria bacterium]|nr:rhodanese-like domain-containing protein [Betaproteobacteria bacterium]